MLYNPNHMICRQSLHLRFFGDVAAVQQFSNELSSWTATVLMPALESLLDSFPVKGRLRIPKFELDAGSIYGEDWQQQLTQRICQQLKAVLMACVTPDMLVERPVIQQGSSIRDWALQIARQKQASAGFGFSADVTATPLRSTGKDNLFATTATDQRGTTGGDISINILGDTSAAGEQLPGSAADAAMANASRQATPGRVPSAMPMGKTFPYNINEYTLNDPVTANVTNGNEFADARHRNSTSYSTDDQTTSADEIFLSTETSYQQRFATYSPASAGEGLVAAASQELIIHYLRHGSLPWHATGLPGSLLRSWLHEYVNAGGMFTDAGRALFTYYPVALQRLLLQCAPDVVLSSYIKFYTPAVDYYYCLNQVLQAVLEAEQGSRLALAIVYELLLPGDAAKSLWQRWLSHHQGGILHQPILDIITVLRTAGSVNDEQLEQWTVQIQHLVSGEVSATATRSMSVVATSAAGYQWLSQAEGGVPGEVNAASIQDSFAELPVINDAAAFGLITLAPFATNENKASSMNHAGPADIPADGLAVVSPNGVVGTGTLNDNSTMKPAKDIIGEITANTTTAKSTNDANSSTEHPAGNSAIDEMYPSLNAVLSGGEHPSGNSPMNDINPSSKAGVDGIEHPAGNAPSNEVNSSSKAAVAGGEDPAGRLPISPAGKATNTGAERPEGSMAANGTILQARTTSTNTSLTLGLLPDEPVADAASYIPTAGLVIVHAVIVPWLTELGLLIDEAWRDAAAHDRAVMLLYYLCTGKCEAADYELALCKLLTGFPLNEPATGCISPTPQETEECVQVLQQVIDQWPVMKNSSVESLRETFLYRDGKLQIKDGKWLLQVASSPFDMLLQHIPWGFSIVRNSKMNALLFVEWA
ncbi:contractile injection system tape measure protein [Chitinophaga sp. sic0106]|uniref:contractile injection system tape measure protein n=1 Tax=Chitinophaga sp. sic0106 TaxID=2854785 RepID=UPI001C4910AD|nr:contractile injection system tape measure protein [Chitinophaga sp. sic0106]MBV7530222.1 hypothetical protein [Chitinophaga sp. sic0106]